MPHAMTLISVGRLQHVACAAWLIFGFGVTSPVSAQTPSSNWMREYVQLRVLSRNLNAVGAARLAGSDPRSLNRPKIVGGTVAGATDNPFQVALLTSSDSNNVTAQYCGGTLVRPNFVVTAAHCSDFVRTDQVQVLTGTRSLAAGGNRRDVSQIVIHPSWNANTFDNDVAVWRLSTDAAGIDGASLATDDGTVGTNLLVTGWGLTSEGGTGAIDLRRVEVPLVDRNNCNDANSYNNQITDRMLCAGLDPGGRDSCQGDSGGPLTGGANNTVLTGIVSWGTGCARPNLFGIYTRVSDPAIRNFIEENIGRGWTFRLQKGTALHETGNNFAFAALANGDLMAIKKAQTGTNSTEVHILSAASIYGQFRLQKGTALHETGNNFAFAALANGDLMAIKKAQTGTNSTEVHILSAASNYGQFKLQTGTALYETDDNFAFAALANEDLMVIKKAQTGTNSTEVHILSAASN